MKALIILFFIPFYSYSIECKGMFDRGEFAKARLTLNDKDYNTAIEKFINDNQHRRDDLLAFLEETVEKRPQLESPVITNYLYENLDPVTGKVKKIQNNETETSKKEKFLGAKLKLGEDAYDVWTKHFIQKNEPKEGKEALSDFLLNLIEQNPKLTSEFILDYLSDRMSNIVFERAKSILSEDAYNTWIKKFIEKNEAKEGKEALSIFLRELINRRPELISDESILEYLGNSVSRIVRETNAIEAREAKETRSE